METAILLSKSERVTWAKNLPGYKTFQQNLHLTEQNDLGNKKVTPTPHPQKRKKKKLTNHSPAKVTKKEGVGVELPWWRSG